MAIVIFNLGGPDKPEAIQPFLFNLFNDPAILMVPNPFRWILAKIISILRAPESKKIYAKVGGKSTLLPETLSQAKAIKNNLSKYFTNFEVFIFMRYWKPSVSEVTKKIKEYNPDNIILMPLYPQFSCTTSGTSIKAFKKEAYRIGLEVPQNVLCCYPTNQEFINASVKNIKQGLNQAETYGKPRLLLSAHGLPEKTIKSGDPYQWQIEETSEAIVNTLGIPNLDHITCYQSRLGPIKWITPSTEEEIKRAGKDNVPVVIVPIAFVSEHVETLVELDIEYRELSIKAGVPFFYRAPVVGTNPIFIEGLTNLIRTSFTEKESIISENFIRKCPSHFGHCPNSYLKK